jgi:hypothetical protein
MAMLLVQASVVLGKCRLQIPASQLRMQCSRAVLLQLLLHGLQEVMTAAALGRVCCWPTPELARSRLPLQRRLLLEKQQRAGQGAAELLMHAGCATGS